jgi:hypothetical protein
LLLWQATLTAFIITSLFGLYLFAGYTFRIKVHYPLVLVTSHVIAAATTTVLFAILMIRMLSSLNQSGTFTAVFALISFALVVLTLMSGIVFYFRFDARRRRTRWGLIITHLMMASLSFIFAISSIATVAEPRHHQKSYTGDAWYRYNLKHRN